MGDWDLQIYGKSVGYGGVKRWGKGNQGILLMLQEKQTGGIDGQG
jgi:hypothetical protein